MRLSLIVTVFNKELFIDSCLESCLNQVGVNQDDYEIVIIDDGSTDNSPCILDAYSISYGCIKVIHQENHGLSIARNNGVKEAIGDYIWFIDADDRISSDAISTLLNAITLSPDVISIKAQTDGDCVTRNNIPVDSQSGHDALLSGRWSHCSPFYVYNRLFLISNNLHFIPGIYHEDSELTPRILYFAKSLVVVDQILYHVYRDPESITQRPRVKRAYDCIEVANSLLSFKESYLLKDKGLSKEFDRTISILINNSLSIISQFDSETCMLFCSELKKSDHLFLSLKNSSLKYWLEFVLFSFTRNYVGSYRLLKKIG